MLCSILAQAVIGSPSFRPVVFFCGRHLDEQDKHSGARGMIKSLIAQILSHNPFVTWLLDTQIVQSACEGNIDALCTLFRFLAYQLPAEVTLFCIIDGIKYYERDAYAYDMGTVLLMLLNLIQDPGMRSRVKLLVASPSETRIVRQAFGDCILSMYSTPIEQYPGTLNLDRVLGT